ncbi:uncharacterized protein LOC108736688 isoform X2 [Agrilus planipennis]|uniref:Uncharacterized protein LOC108736688 isoform X2 n=1 Tax=Agrilus planipennis TaxID=224129 RepID=A0A1W4WLE4_AGRPL|nr:uncharacterized protein LOC108736688 isoform X2 [Agrilus planipennis]
MITTFFGIKCYQCRDDTEKDCVGNPMKYLKECAEKTGTSRERYCRKVSYKIYFLPKEKDVIVRECAYNNDEGDKCYYSSEWNKGSSFICECPTDGCNESSHDPIVSFTLMGYCLGFVFWNFPS